MRLNYETLDIPAGQDIAPLILEACGCNLDKFEQAYEYASSLFPERTYRMIPALVAATSTKKNAASMYRDISSKAYEIAVGITLARKAEVKETGHHKKKTALRYGVYVLDDMGLRHATDIDVCFPETCVEVTTTDDGVLRVSDLQTSRRKDCKWGFMQDPETVYFRQRQKIKKLKKALLVLPGQVELDTNCLEDESEKIALAESIKYIRDIQNTINLYVVKTNVWDGVKYMHSGLDITPERLELLHKTNISNMSIPKAIRLLGGNPREVLGNGL